VIDFLDETRKEIAERLRELKPAVDEYNRLEAAASALKGVSGSTMATSRRRGPGRPRGSVSRKGAAATAAPAKALAKKPGRPPGKRRAGRRKGSPPRAVEALSFVQSQPGITIPELAAKMGINQNYLYRVLPGLQQDNKVSKRGRGWHPMKAK
jgi:hypothetical protein